MIPLRFREIETAPANLLFTSDAGRSFIAAPDFLENYIFGKLSHEQQRFLKNYGPPRDIDDSVGGISYLYNLSQRHSTRRHLDYFILIPTLRCNLSCSYCQVSRAPEHASGFDWDDRTTAAAIDIICQSEATEIKLEFQGGEPTLRLDLIQQILDSVEPHKKSVEAVICTNLSDVSPQLIELMERGNVFVSTSIDGDLARQSRQRTGSTELASAFFKNVDLIIEKFSAQKISALPTIDPQNPPTYNELYRAFVDRGFHSLYLRPINYQGFARKRHAESQSRAQSWSEYYTGFIQFLIATGEETNYAVHEFYFVQMLRRIVRPGENGHVDLRNPCLFGVDYIVIDQEGRLFPTDEARMLDRIGEVDLSIGNVHSGVDRGKQRQLNELAFNDDDPDCAHCAFQPYCGSDVVDAVSRYGRSDLPRGETVFCRNQLDLFDFAFSMLADPTPDERKALARWLELPEPPRRFLETAP